MDKKKTIDFDRETFLSLKEQHAKASEEKREQFSFQGHILLTSYAKYLIEHLSPRFEKDKN